MTPNAYLERHVADLLSMRIDYAFLRNSEGYPATLTGDIDLLVKIGDIAEIQKYYNNLDSSKVQAVQIIRKRRDLYVMLYFPQSLDRKFLVLEYFTGIVYRGQVIVPGERLLDNCEVDGIWRRLSKSVSISYTYIHYIAYKEYLPAKYQNDYEEYGLSEQVTRQLLMFLGGGKKYDLDSMCPAALSRHIRQEISKVKIVVNYAQQLLYLRPKSLGCVLKVNPDDAQECIDYADKYHLFRPTHRYIIRSNPVFAIFVGLAITLLGGLAVLPTRRIAPRKNPSKYFEDKISRACQ